MHATIRSNLIITEANIDAILLVSNKIFCFVQCLQSGNHQFTITHMV